MRTALIMLALLGSVTLLACGLETSAGPGKKDSGVMSGSGAGGGSGSNASPAGDGGDSGTAAGTGASGSSGRGGSSDSGTSGTGTGGADDAGSGTGGTTGGSGGSGTSGCGGDMDCPADHPQCNADGQCGPCTSGSACEARDGTKHCELGGGAAQGQCVQCLQSDDCADPAAAHCVNNACVECEAHADCTDASKPQCTAGTCTACTDAAACEGRAEGAHCVTDAGDAAAGTCVACTEHSHCDAATPECGADHVCGACTSNDACAGRTGTTICDLSSDVAFAGKCVQCTGTQYAACTQGANKFVCDSKARTCSTTALEHSGDPCVACISDAQCQEGMLCALQRFNDPFDDPDQGVIGDIGYVCTWRIDAPDGPNGDCVLERPYVQLVEDATSIDGTTADVCTLALTTCPAYLDFRSKDCQTTSGTGDDSLCGAAGIADGYCGASGASTFLCTTACGGNVDCKPGFTCGGNNPSTCRSPSSTP